MVCLNFSITIVGHHCYACTCTSMHGLNGCNLHNPYFCHLIIYSLLFQSSKFVSTTFSMQKKHLQEPKVFVTIIAIERANIWFCQEWLFVVLLIVHNILLLIMNSRYKTDKKSLYILTYCTFYISILLFPYWKPLALFFGRLFMYYNTNKRAVKTLTNKNWRF